VLFFAPHPDDETIAGGLALRLMREAKMQVYNVAVTQGSKKERQAARLVELQRACDYLGFGLITTGPNGLEKINSATRQNDSAHWAACVSVIRGILEKHRPRAILFPHEQDWNSTHIGTHFLIMDALSQMPMDFECFLVETEFWGQMDDPNLMVEISEPDLADMIAATSFHIGEVERNPYHVLLPAWMLDNVRRGSELVGGKAGWKSCLQAANKSRIGPTLGRSFHEGQVHARSHRAFFQNDAPRGRRTLRGGHREEQSSGWPRIQPGYLNQRPYRSCRDCGDPRCLPAAKNFRPDWLRPLYELRALSDVFVGDLLGAAAQSFFWKHPQGRGAHRLR
jgi:hypothetical protein